VFDFVASSSAIDLAASMLALGCTKSQDMGVNMLRIIIIAAVLNLGAAAVPAADWPMAGRNFTRNPASPETGAPTDWQIGTVDMAPRNIRWSVPAGTRAIGGPVIANGLIWVGTNNKDPLDPNVKGDRGVLACFRETDGKFLYQYTSPRLEHKRMIADWPESGLSGSPVTEGDKLWFITNRREVVCLDTSPLRRSDGPAKGIWKYDLVKEQGVFPNSPMIPGHNNLGSPAVYKDLLFVPTGNGVDVDHPGATRVRAPEAPSLVCLRKDTGKVVWKDNSPGKEIYGGHYASPLVIEVGSTIQVIHPQGDGWVRSFDARTGKLIWQFDTNRKGAKWDWIDGTGTAKHVVVATPVYANGRVYFAAGREPEFAGGQGRLFCIDPTGSGDISPELDDGAAMGKPNPNSGLVWDFTKDGDKDSQVMHQTISCVAVKDGLAVVPDRLGYVHCFDAKTGKRYWTHDTRAGQFGDPLIVDGKVYAANDEGYVTILELAKTLKVLARHDMDQVIVAPPVFANGKLYVLTELRLYALGTQR
jgi:outer membrane protein assembly factor BamB